MSEEIKNTATDNLSRIIEKEEIKVEQPIVLQPATSSITSNIQNLLVQTNCEQVDGVDEVDEKINYQPYDTLVLAGGGIKGFAMLGAIQALMDEKKLEKITNYVGTSIGSIINYLLCIGYTPMEIIITTFKNRIIERIPNFNFVDVANGNGILKFTFFQEELEKMTLEKIGKFLTLSKLRELYGKSLTCVTYNLTTCSTEYLGPDNYPDLPCLTAIKMSSNIPLIFERFKYMDCFYIDGGITENFPISKGKELGNRIIGINFVISEKYLIDNPSEGMLKYALRLIKIQHAHYAKLRIIPKNCDVINISVENEFYDFKVSSKLRLELFSQGYCCVKNKNETIKNEIST